MIVKLGKIVYLITQCHLLQEDLFRKVCDEIRFNVKQNCLEKIEIDILSLTENTEFWQFIDKLT